MNLQPINPYQIIKGLTKEIEVLKAENEALRAEVAEYAVMAEHSNGPDTE